MPAGHGLGIFKGETWAYRQGANKPLTPVEILDPGTHYDAQILIRLIDQPDQPPHRVRRVKLPCKWSHVDEYMERYRAKQAVAEAAAAEARKQADAKEVPHEPITEQEVMLLVTLDNQITFPIAYNMDAAAAAVGYSSSTLRNAIQRGELFPRYANSRPIILREELLAWANQLPIDKP